MPMSRRTLAVIAVGLLTGLAGCNRDARPTTALSPDQFVDVVVALREAAVRAPDQASFEVERDRVLREAAVTDSMLLEFVRVRGRDIDAMRAVWDSVAARRRIDTDPIEVN
jgi:hypothetical protein